MLGFVNIWCIYHVQLTVIITSTTGQSGKCKQQLPSLTAFPLTPSITPAEKKVANDRSILFLQTHKRPKTTTTTEQGGFRQAGRRSRGGNILYNPRSSSPSSDNNKDYISSSASYNKRKLSVTSRNGDDDEDEFDPRSTDGGVSWPDTVSWASSFAAQHRAASSAGGSGGRQPTTVRQKRPLWPTGSKRPRVGKENAHPRCRRAAETMVDACVGKGPLEGLARRVLVCGRDGERDNGRRPGEGGSDLGVQIGFLGGGGLAVIVMFCFILFCLGGLKDRGGDFCFCCPAPLSSIVAWVFVSVLSIGFGFESEYPLCCSFVPSRACR